MKETILITGGTGKFGRQFIQHFIQKGWVVLFTTTNKERGDQLISQFDSDNLISFVADLTIPDSISQLVDSIHNKGYTVNHLVNNARSLDSLITNSLDQTDRQPFIDEYLMDVVIPYELSMALYNAQASSLRTITNIGSQYGMVAANPNLYDNYPSQSPIQYGTAKAALVHLTKELAVRFANENIRVNCISYGGVEGRVDEGFKERYAQLVPIGRMLSESELAGPLELIISDSCSAINGQTIQADGGWTLW
jgi:NAD(P)-dependent dehydrogenase (short-subunit alcohol dehydrogenase family)